MLELFDCNVDIRMVDGAVGNRFHDVRSCFVQAYLDSSPLTQGLDCQLDVRSPLRCISNMNYYTKGRLFKKQMIEIGWNQLCMVMFSDAKKRRARWRMGVFPMKSPATVQPEQTPKWTHFSSSTVLETADEGAIFPNRSFVVFVAAVASNFRVRIFHASFNNSISIVSSFTWWKSLNKPGSDSLSLISLS